MALDKQRILNELGNVVNQLKSAECGCLGNVFSGQNAGGQLMGSSLPTCGGCRRGCCQGHGYGGCGGAPAGDSMNMNRPCMGRCNAPQVFSDTYGYLNQNLMQPVVKEVYDDLRSLTPANTISNNPMANQMGLPPGNAANPMMSAMAGQSQPGMGMQGMSGMSGGPGMNNPNSQMSAMGGMGEQIMKMMMSSGGRPKGMPPQGQMTSSAPMNPNSSHGQAGMAPMMGSNSGETGNLAMFMGQGDPSANQTQYMGQGSMNPQMMNPPTQYVAKDNTYTVGHAQMNPTSGAGIMPQNMNPALVPRVPQIVGGNLGQSLGLGGQQMNASPMGNSSNYGQHTPGVNKFNEMFPGLMQQGELGFDPMAIAIQMNPANQQKAAMDTIQKLMNNKVGSAAANLMATGGQANLSQNLALNQQIPQSQQEAIPGQQQILPVQQQVVPDQQQLIQGQQVPKQQQQSVPIQQQLPHGQQQLVNPNSGTGQPNQQQVYTAVTGEQKFQGQQQQQMVDPNTGNVVESPTVYEASGDDPTAPTATEMYKEPIFPADTSKDNPLHYQPRFPHKLFNQTEYNTLGQPIERVPGHLYNVPMPSLPQTLSPRTPSRLKTNMGKLGVKSTVSKTSLAGLKPVGRIPSRSQLQQIYQEYKVPQSHSFTHQNIKVPVQRGTASDGKLNAALVDNTPKQQVPIEKVGGDTIANNQMGKVKEQIGDLPGSLKPRAEGEIDKSRPMKPTRNGLQDMVYTSYPSNAAWSFHGDYAPPMPSLFYRSKINTAPRRMR